MLKKLTDAFGVKNGEELPLLDRLHRIAFWMFFGSGLILPIAALIEGMPASVSSEGAHRYGAVTAVCISMLFPSTLALLILTGAQMLRDEKPTDTPSQTKSQGR